MAKHSPRYPRKRCAGCAGPLNFNAVTSYCTRNPECRRANKRQREPRKRTMCKCTRCGGPTYSKFSVCQRTPDCHRYYQALWAAARA